MSPRILVVGSAIVDHVATCPRHPNDGETIIGTGFGVYPGGKGLNQAVAVARLGGRATFCGAVGNDSPGALLLQTLREEEVTVEVAQTDLPTGAALISVDSRGQNRILVCPGACGALTPAHVEAAWGSGEFDAVLVQLEVPFAAVRAALSLARAAGKLAVLNPAPAPDSLPDFLDLADVLTPNEMEAERLTGIAPTDADSCRACAHRLHAMGVGRVVLTLGEAGCFVSDSDGRGMIEGQPVKAVDSTAAGDVFSAALTLSLADGKSLTEAATFANRVAALSVTKAGAVPSIPRLADLLA